jgi:hypothetical protein
MVAMPFKRRTFLSAPPRLRARLFVVQLLVIPVIVSIVPGCQSFKAPDWSKMWFNQPRVQDSKYAVPARMAILWSPAIYNEAGKPPTRGFGGRIYFFDAKNKPVSVEGQLVVYAYNNNTQRPESKVPDRKFAFTPEQFTKHYTPTELGASYSIWIPWDAVGGPQTEISLVPVFTSTSGALVMEQPSRNLLPGSHTPVPEARVIDCTLPAVDVRVTKPTEQQAQSDPGVQQASFAAPTTGMAVRDLTTPVITRQGGVETMSINVPGTMADRLAQAPPQISTLQRMAELRQEALRAQAAGAPPISPINASPLNIPAAPTAPNQTLGGVPQPWFQNSSGSPPPARFAPPSPPAPIGPGPLRAGGPPPTQPSPATQPSGLLATPESAQAGLALESSSGALKNR